MPTDDSERPHDDQGDAALSAFFFFPCYSGDDGSRPAPSASVVCSYRSDAILLDGVPHDGRFLAPNQALQLSAVVTNQGALAAPALVTILYAPMSAQFTTDLKLAVQFSDFWLSGQTKTVGPAQWLVPAGIPSHVCLLAAVDSILDPIPTPLPQSIADRHYAQCNLDFLELAPGSSISIPVLLGQGSVPGQRMLARVRSDLSAGAAAFARSRLLHLDVELSRTVQYVLESRGSQQQGKVLEFDAREGDQEARLVVQMPSDARPGQAVILTLEQFAATREDEWPVLVGSFALVVTMR
jgi:hypothetical protein